MGGEVGKGGCQACTRPTSSRACPPPRPAVAATLAEIANTTGSALSPTAQGVAQRVEDSLGVVALLLAAAEEGALAGAGVNAPLAESAPHFQMTPAPENTPRSRRLLGTLSLGMSQGNYSAATYSISTGTDRATSVVRGVLCGGGGASHRAAAPTCPPQPWLSPPASPPRTATQGVAQGGAVAVNSLSCLFNGAACTKPTATATTNVQATGGGEVVASATAGAAGETTRARTDTRVWSLPRVGGR